LQKRLSWSLPSEPKDLQKLISWQPEDERWSDEVPLARAPKIECGLHFPAGRKGRSARELLGDEAEAVRAVRLGLSEGSSARAALLLDEAVVRARLDEWGEVWVLERMLEKEADSLNPKETAEASILAGLAAEHEDRLSDALERWQRAAKLPLLRDEQQFVDLQRQRLLVQFGRLEEARELLDSYSNLPGALGRYFRYRSALVHFQLGDEAGTLAIARELNSKQSAAEVASDPISHALEELVFLQLLHHPFSLETVELVESLGQVNEVYRRMDSLGTLAIERNKPQLAIAVYHWLLDEHSSKYSRPYYLARLSAAAAAAGDSATFKSAFPTLVGKMIPKDGAKKKRNVEWDRQILLGSRDAIAFLAARKDTASLKIVTQELQAYLRAKKDQLPYAELTTLYRLASLELADSARGYAEKVGVERSPVWLGEVTIDRPRVVVPDPTLAVPSMEGPVSLLCLPDGPTKSCVRWFGPPERGGDAR
jgi:hypothetical protein